MIPQIFFYIAGSITIIWGISHLFPTKAVVKGFGEISPDNKNIISMEWIVEGVSLVFIGIIITGVTLIDMTSRVAHFVYVSSAYILIILAVVSFFTGFRINFLPFKLCPLLFSLSSILIILGCIFENII